MSQRLEKFESIVLRKSRSAIDRPLSELELRASDIRIKDRTTYIDRTIYRELLPCLHGDLPVVYDIGAHKGHYIRALAKLSSIQHIIGFEPIPSSFEEAVARTKAIPTVRLFNCALGPTNCEVEFHLNDFSPSSSVLEMDQNHKEFFPKTATSTMISVKQYRLDDLISQENLPKPTLIKIDVQGYESQVFEGAECALSSANYVLTEVSFISLYEGSELAHEMITRLHRLGFALRGFSEPLRDSLGAWISANALFVRR